MMRFGKGFWIGLLGVFTTGLMVSSALAFFVPAARVGTMRLLQLSQGEVPQRIVSLAPGITEVLFALGAGKKVKGVTDFCDFPEPVKKLPKVGGFYDPNFEKIMSLRPDLVILYPEHRELRPRFQQLNISTLTVDMHSLTGIMSTCLQLGAICRTEARGAALAEQFRQVRLAAKSFPAPPSSQRVLLVIGRDYDSPTPQEVYIAGRGEFYDELIGLAGGQNAYSKSAPKYPKVSVEGLLSLRPDIIIELIPEPDQIARPLDALRQDWKRVPGLRAARQPRVHMLTGSHTVRPGPRLLLLLREFSEILREEPEGK